MQVDCKAFLDTLCVKHYLTKMIKTFKSKALEKFWSKNDRRGIRPDFLAKVTRLLSALDAAEDPEDLNIPGFGFHLLTGNRAGTYSLKVNRNWRITFQWDHGAVNIDLEDYH